MTKVDTKAMILNGTEADNKRLNKWFEDGYEFVEGFPLSGDRVWVVVEKRSRSGYDDGYDD